MSKKLPLPVKPGQVFHWGQLQAGSMALTVTQIAQETSSMVIVLTPDTHTANRLERECHFFADQQIPILHLMDWETLPYDRFSPHHDIISQRLKTLYQLPQCHRGILIVPIPTLMHRLPPVAYIQDTSFILNKGDTFDIADTRRHFEQRGYYAVSQVMSHGEYAVRGSIFDLYPMGSELPFRIDLFDNEIESIRRFDPQTQRTLETVTALQLLPAREYPLNEDSIALFRQQWRDHFKGNPLDCPVYQDISHGLSSSGVEYYLPLFFEKTATLFDYFPKDSIILTLANDQAAAQQCWQEVHQRYEQCALDPRRPLLPPEFLFLRSDELFHLCNQYPQLRLHQEPLEEKTGNTNLPYTGLPDLTIHHKLEHPLTALKNFVKETTQPILFCAESAGRKEALLELLQKHGLHPISIQHWQEFLDTSSPINIMISPLEHGFIDTAHPYAIIAEPDLLGEHVLQTRRRRQQRQDPDAILRNLAELSIGSPVVHIDHGVGRFLGLQRLQTGGVDAEYLTIGYANDDKLYVPVASLHLISRYSGIDPDHAPIHQLGTPKWDLAKQKAAEKARDVAAELLDVYARRAARKGFSFKHPEEQYIAFANSFGFAETIDQENAIQDVLQDMTSDKPMDRLICGDVGFGKTEVAIRAAFVAVQNNLQVGVLVPTTLLAQQHYETFCDRFADWAVNIEVLSRFKTKNEQTITLEKLSQKKVDILIGTHKLLQTDVKFSNLGLLIIDEEHRFGVQQKEHLKSLRSEVDILTLTATPIPRTLNMSIAGMRDLSIIATPPEKRLAIKTFVVEKNNGIMREAILREILRGGQVFFLHNKVEDIEKITEELRTLIPEARVGIGHGQMHERELERVMYDFYHQRFNLLVCTTIIETGIDIPSANTIIINKADRFGLAQLHQLRGRVGRSHHQAYAYLMVDDKKALTTDAEKRLEAISLLEDLGIGFALATQDLEIRGAGELLGQEQSGNIQAIGFSLYNDLLARAVSALKRGESFDFTKPFEQSIEVDLMLATLIPEDYLPDVHERLQLYKRIANAKNDEQLDDLQAEMIDRFGLLPIPTQQLFSTTRLKLLAEPLGIQKIEAGPQGGRLLFKEKTNVNPKTIISLLQDKSQQYQLAGPTALRFKRPLEQPIERITFVENLLKLLSAPPKSM